MPERLCIINASKINIHKLVLPVNPAHIPCAVSSGPREPARRSKRKHTQDYVHYSCSPKFRIISAASEEIAKHTFSTVRSRPFQVDGNENYPSISRDLYICFAALLHGGTGVFFNGIQPTNHCLELEIPMSGTLQVSIDFRTLKEKGH